MTSATEKARNYGNYAEDCIHLHACRLMARRYRHAGCKHVARHCDDECVCYQTFEVVDEMEYIDPGTASRIAQSAVDDLAYGYSEDDLQVEISAFIAANTEVREIGLIVNGVNCTDDNGLDDLEV